MNANLGSVSSSADDERRHGKQRYADHQSDEYDEIRHPELGPMFEEHMALPFNFSFIVRLFDGLSDHAHPLRLADSGLLGGQLSKVPPLRYGTAIARICPV